MSKDPIAAYAQAAKPQQQAICASLRKSIDAALPKATVKIWHAIPVWFIGENAVVGYHAKPAGVTLMFWNGQSFDEPGLEAVGKFHAAQVKYSDVGDLDAKLLARWLRKAKADVWDMVGERKAALSKKKAA
ncbi:MAG TPA: DUF1801 domain-containing protein [Steroidobacteraceae bacterium]|nr:DUF1801 domain-containing protein [Steroidobacteraceae bacterium]